MQTHGRLVKSTVNFQRKEIFWKKSWLDISDLTSRQNSSNSRRSMAWRPVSCGHRSTFISSRLFSRRYANSLSLSSSSSGLSRWMRQRSGGEAERLKEAEEAPVKKRERKSERDEKDKKSREHQPTGVSNVREAAAAATCRQEMLPRTTVVTGQSEESSRLQHHILLKQRGDNIDNDTRTEEESVCENNAKFFPRTHGLSLLL